MRRERDTGRADFSVFPGVWRHGDWIKVSEDGSCVIYGRSDATIKRMGVRLGTSEIYRVVESLPRVADSLVVDMEFLGGRSYMPLFIVPREGSVLDGSLKAEIIGKIRNEISPKMVPDEIVAVSEIPRTINGKKLGGPREEDIPWQRPRQGLQPGLAQEPILDGVLPRVRSEVEGVKRFI